MAEASLYDRALAALAIRQSRGDMIEAIFILRAYRTTLPRFNFVAASMRPRSLRFCACGVCRSNTLA